MIHTLELRSCCFIWSTILV